MQIDSSQSHLEVVDLLLRGASLTEVLDSVCTTIDTLTPGVCCCLLLADPSNSWLHCGAAPGMPDEFREIVDRLPIAPEGRLYGTCGWNQCRLLVEDIFLHPELEKFYPSFRQVGLAGCWCDPIVDGAGRLLGVYAVHLPPSANFDDRLLPQGARLARFALERAELLKRKGQSQRLLEQAYKMTDMAVCFCDGLKPRAPVRMVNHSLCLLLGGSQDDWLGLPLVRLLPDVADLLDPVVRLGQSTAVTRGQRLDGSTFPCEIRLTAVSDDFDKTTYLLAAMVDISRRIEVCHSERQIEARFRRIFEEVPHIAVRGCAPDGSVRFWNSASERLFGYSANEVMNCRLPHGSESGPTQSNEYELLRKDGTPVLVFGASVAISTPGVGLEVYTLEVDLSPLKEAEKERIQLLQLLLQAQKLEALGQLTGGVAHDFNNVLATILGNIELARQEMSPALLDEMQMSAERAQELVRQMLLYSRPSRSRPKATFLQEPIQEIYRVLKAVVPSSLDLRLNLDHDTPSAVFDPGDLHQILTNLVINSRDALQGQGVIEVGLRLVNPNPPMVCSSCLATVCGPHVEVWVEDNGPGIDEAIRGRLFDPFFTTKGPSKGSGLGLAVLHRLVHERGGHVVVGRGPGAHFSVILQLAKERAQAAPPPTSCGQPLVLIVDDEPMLAKMLGKLVKTQGYDVQVFTDSLAAWTEFCATPLRYAALVTDQTMPGKTGEEFARDALKIRPDLPIILCTGFSEQIDADSARAMGIRHFLQKPVKPAVLFETLAAMIARP
ncbi:response regulator [bacterium]|nr:response regulator [bacterium]